MAVQILRRPKAIEDIEEIADYIAADSLQAAMRFLENTESTLQGLAEFPSSGGFFIRNIPSWQVCGFAESRVSQIM
ncbi:MAG: hypothetical protein COA78_19335 [Blastopirellula sp.]|nr:MAG: hypothetical protein COA78_19335 [Blastopirellula sp.]